MKEGKKFEKIEQKEDLSSVLDRYFKNEELSKKELKMVEKHRKECIEEVKEKSYRFKDIGSSLGGGPLLEGFAYASGLNLNMRIKNAVDFFCSLGLKKTKTKIESYYTWPDPIEGRTVIDIGSGMFPKDKAKFIMHRGAEKYIAVDLEPPDLDYFKENMEGSMRKGQELESVESDMLEYLLTLEDESSIVISSGSTMQREVIRGKSSVDYLHFLAHEIARVTPEKGITYHYEYDPFFKIFLEEEGFKRIEDKKKNEQISGLWIKMSEKEKEE